MEIEWRKYKKRLTKSRRPKGHTMMNNTINEIKNSLEGVNSRTTEAAERLSDLEDKLV